MFEDLSQCPHCTMRFVRPSAEGVAKHIAEQHPQHVAKPEPVAAPAPELSFRERAMAIAREEMAKHGVKQ